MTLCGSIRHAELSENFRELLEKFRDTAKYFKVFFCKLVDLGSLMQVSLFTGSLDYMLMLLAYFAGGFHHFMYRFTCLHADAACILCFAPSH